MFIFLVFSTLGYGQQIHVDSVRYASETGRAKVIFEVTSSPKHRVFVLDNPSRLVIDVKNTQADQGLGQPSASHPLFAHVRAAAKNDSDLRIVIDLKQAITAKSHKLATNNSDNQHLVIDLLNKNSGNSVDKVKKTSEKLAYSKPSNLDEQTETTTKTSNSRSKHAVNKKQRFVIAIDAGHGGDDPGARGPNGTHEKQVTLAIAKKLEALINAQPGMKAKMVRKGDYYVGLRERIKIARLAKADLFISIHADAFQNAEVKGASVFTLSRNGASNEAARWLANSENAREKVGGVNLDDKEDVLASVLLDLSQTATQQASVSLAGNVLKNFQNIGSLHYSTVQKAGFVVLKSPDVPSILVETAFISNPSDELNLLSARYQTKMANAIFNGVLNYFEQLEPSETNRMAKL
ncbi:N-acetylmuramoyl-L-alanine amidase [Methyloglobulus sp.]|uniref:N-acetylmuramoyl-L-alanine amidase n=1 Tax=Methyloglobulus sp. TaxID=2518622 RepID=UPI0032B80BD6